MTGQMLVIETDDSWLEDRLGPADSEGGRSRPSMAFATLAHPCAAYEVDPLECVNCASNMRIIALIDNVDVVERILRHLDQWDPQHDYRSRLEPGKNGLGNGVDSDKSEF